MANFATPPQQKKITTNASTNICVFFCIETPMSCIFGSLERDWPSLVNLLAYSDFSCLIFRESSTSKFKTYIYASDKFWGLIVVLCIQSIDQVLFSLFDSVCKTTPPRKALRLCLVSFMHVN